MKTFEQSDYLCIMPFAWARSKTAREAFRACKANVPGSTYVPDRKKAPAMIWRLSDAVDQVEVNDFGGFSYRPGEGFVKDDVEARLVYKGNVADDYRKVDEQLIDAVEG